MSTPEPTERATPTLGSPALARWLCALLLGSILLGAAMWALGYGRPHTEPLPTGRSVVVVSVPGLTWADTGRVTPEIDRESDNGATGALTPRAAGPRACTADGWLTLGAGRGAGLSRDTCPDPVAEQVLTGDAEPGERPTIADWQRFEDAAAASSLDPRLGLLADTLASNDLCVTAMDDISAYGAADSSGAVRFQDQECSVRLVDAAAQATAQSLPLTPVTMDEVVRQQRFLNPDAVLVVAGLADDDTRVGLRVLTVAGPDVRAGEVWSGTTRQVPVAQTSDLTATVLHLAGVTEIPSTVSGRALTVVPGRIGAEAGLERRAAAESESAAAAAAQDGTIPALGWTYGLGLVLALGLGAGVLRGSVRTRARSLRGLHALALVAAAIPVASLVQRGANLWSLLGREQAGLLGALSLVLIAAVVAGLATLAPGRRTVLGPLATVLAFTVAVICVDVMSGSGWQLGSYFGLQAIVGGRFYGVGNPMFGLLATATLLTLAALVASRTRSRGTAVLVLVVGLAVVAVGVAPMWGADFGGLPALLPALGVLAFSVSGIRLSWGRAVLIGAVTLLALVAVCVADWLRPAEQRTHLGAFVQTVLDGEAWGIVTRKLEQNWTVLTEAPLAWLVPIGLVLFAVAALRPTTRLGRLVHEPVERLGLPSSLPLAIAVLWVLGFAVNDTGAAVVATGAALLIPAFIGWRARCRIEDEAPPGTPVSAA